MDSEVQELVPIDDDKKTKEVRLRKPDRGATTAEYAITTLAACGFAALLVVLLKSDGIQSVISGVITNALNLGG